MMKKFLSIVVSVKANACICFMAWMFLAAVGYTVCGVSEISLSVVWQFIALSVIAAAFQLVAFSSLVFKKLRYSLRMLVFCLPFLAVLSGFAWVFHWFPTGELLSWVIFWGSFFVLLIAMTIGFEIAFRIAGKRYDGLLGEYHKKNQKS